jgi:hypothetical protein
VREPGVHSRADFSHKCVEMPYKRVRTPIRPLYLGLFKELQCNVFEVALVMGT